MAGGNDRRCRPPFQLIWGVDMKSVTQVT